MDHVRPDLQSYCDICRSGLRRKPSGIIELEAPLHASNAMLICPRCGRAARTGHRFLEEVDHKGRSRKVRFCKACDEVVDE